MQTSLIVSVVGSDRPGLVEKLSEVVTRAGGNWEGSRMMRLAGQFTGMVQVVIDEAKLPQLEADMASLEASGLRVAVMHSADSSVSPESEETALRIEVVGQDRPGIVAAISKSLAETNVNVIELGHHSPIR